MNTRIRTSVLFVLLYSAWLFATPVAAQLGSLVVSITSPTSGSTVTGTIPVNASVTIVGFLTVSGVQFKLDGVNIGAEDTSAPYSIQFNTRTASNGAHTLTAVARDILGVRWTSPSVNVTVFNDTTAPTVSITSPASGVTVRGDLNIAATAADNVGVVGVQFKIDGANLGAEDTTAPYGMAWNTTTATNGSHALTAVARDAAGNTATSATVTMTVDNSAPAITISSPVAGSIVTGAITATANASDNIGVVGVQFKVDGANLGTEDTVTPYAVSWNTTAATNGAHSVTAVARDAAGNTTTSSNVAVTVDNAAPAVAITSPAAGNVSGTITVAANASDNIAVAGVQFTLDGALLGAEDTVSPYEVSWDTNSATGGSHSLAAIARDSAGNTSTSAAVAVTVLNDSTPPSVSITSPVNGATVTGTVAITASASDDVGVSGVQFFVDGAALGAEDATAPYEASWDASAAAAGSHALTAVARDAAGHTTTSAAVAVTVGEQGGGQTVTRLEDTHPDIVYAPSSSWLLGFTGTYGWSGGSTSLGFVAGGRATLTFTGTGVSWIGFRGPQAGIANVYLDGALVATVDEYDPTATAQLPLYTASGLANGTHAISIEVTHTKNDASSDYFVVVDAFDITTQGGTPSDTAAPTVSVTSPVEGATVSASVTLSATASDDIGVTRVRFYVDGNPFGDEDTTAPYEIAWNTSTVANGAHTVMAQARDAAGNTGLSTIVHVTVSNTEPPPPPPPPPGGNVRLEDGNTAITYHGAWNVGNTSRPWSGGTAAVGFGTGQDAVVTFRGTGITWIGFRGNWAGIAKVYVDGVLNTTLDLYAPTEAVQAQVFSVSGLPLGTHTLTVEVTRTKNAASADFIVIVDAFDIIDAPADTVAPTVSISTPADGATVFGTLPVRANADDDTGIASVTFFVDGSQVDSVDSISPYSINWNTTALSDGPHTLTAVARDAAGNTTTSSPVSVTVANAAPPATASATRVENTDLGIIYVDGCSTCGGPAASWFHGSRSRQWSDGTSSFNRADGGRATYTFTGTAVKWIGFRAAWAGIARVFVDGAFVTEIDLFSPTEEVQVPVFQVADLAPGTHTIAVEATGRKNAEATDDAVVLDAFDISPALPPPVTGTRFEQNAPSATFTAGWNMTDTSQAWSGTTAAVSSTAAERATFVFTGTSAMWIGKRGPDMGIARVYLDGSLQAQVDGYYPSSIQGLVYSVTNLVPGEHRLEIEVTGLKNAQATGAAVAVDAFDIRSRIEQNDSPVVYTGTWRFDDTTRNYSDTSLTTGVGTAAVADTAGARAELTFNGSGATVRGIRTAFSGIADVYVDGAFAQRVDLYSSTEEIQAPIFTVSGLAPGTHTLRIEATGTKNAASTTARVFVDAFDVTLPNPSPRITRAQETDAAVVYSSGWHGSGSVSLWSGATAKESTVVGEQATFTFSGTAIRWIGERGFSTGLARVSIDGQFIGVVDTRTPFQEEYQEPIFIVNGLAAGTHTLTIEVAGRNNEGAGATVERVVIDAFDFYQQ